MNYCIDLILGKAFCIFIFFHFPDSRLSVLKGFHFYFCFLTWVKTENCFLILGDEFLFLNHFYIFRFFCFVILCYFFIVNFYKNYVIIIILFNQFFFMKITFIFSCSGMFRYVPACPGMFRNVPKCSMFLLLSTPVSETILVADRNAGHKVHWYSRL